MMIAATLLLAACGSNEEKEVASGTYTDPETGESADYKVTSSEDGESSNVSIKTEDGEMRFGGGAANAKLPAGFTAYPGATLTGGYAATGTEGPGGMASFEADAQAADVIAHIQKQALAQGMKITTEIKSGETMIIGAEKPGDQEGEGVAEAQCVVHRRDQHQQQRKHDCPAARRGQDEHPMLLEDDGDRIDLLPIQHPVDGRGAPPAEGGQHGRGTHHARALRERAPGEEWPPPQRRPIAPSR